jgi:hypothetical protein
MPFLFNRDLAHRSLPDVLKAGWWAKFAPIKLSRGPFGSSPKIKLSQPQIQNRPSQTKSPAERPG